MFTHLKVFVVLGLVLAMSPDRFKLFGAEVNGQVAQAGTLVPPATNRWYLRIPFNLNVVTDLQLDLAGRVLVAGSLEENPSVWPPTALARFFADGRRDTSLVSRARSQSLAPGTPRVRVQSDGTIILTGIPEKILALTETGEVPPDWQGGLPAVAYEIRDVALQSDDKILILGEYFLDGPGSPTKDRILRLLPNGQRDTFADTGTIYRSPIAVQPDGSFFASQLASRSLMRFTQDGAPDETFTPFVLDLFRDATAIEVAPNGDVLVAGLREGTHRLFRLQSDGVPVADFRSPTFNDAVYDILLEADGRIVLGGAFTNVNGQVKNRLARLKADGQVDDTFDVGAGPNKGVSKLLKLPNGNILVGGAFGTFSGITARALAEIRSGVEEGQFTSVALEAGELVLTYAPPQGTNDLTIESSVDLKVWHELTPPSSGTLKLPLDSQWKFFRMRVE